jgi:signal transduction histidine kinase
VIQSSAENLLTIFNDILDVARLEAGVVEMAQVSFDLGEVLRGIEAKVRADAQAKGLAFEMSAGDQPWPRLVGDPARIRQVLAHLAGNAVKFTDQGEVAIAVRRRPLGAGATWIRFEVIDTGPGISPALRTALFEPFRQADGGVTRRHGGAGLGLAICRHAVRLMGGAIGVADHPESGSIFWVELTLPNVQAAVAA